MEKADREIINNCPFIIDHAGDLQPGSFSCHQQRSATDQNGQQAVFNCGASVEVYYEIPTGFWATLWAFISRKPVKQAYVANHEYAACLKASRFERGE